MPNPPRRAATTSRRKLVVALALGLLAGPEARAQPRARRLPKIGLLLTTTAPASGETRPLLEAFGRALRELGYVDGQNVVVEHRWAGGHEEQLPALARELAALPVDVIVTQGAPAVRAARSATATIPIVAAFVGDPVGIGAAETLARPGGNFTGLSLLDAELDGKRIEMLKEIVPGLSRIAMLWSPTDSGMALAFGRVDVATRSLGLALQSLEVRQPEALPAAFEAARTGRAQALVVTAQPFSLRHRAQILDLVAAYRMPVMFTLRDFVDGGGLMSYGPSLSDLYRRAASYVDKILRGANPAELPIEQPTKFELVVNLRAAEALGLAIPQRILLRADELIR